MGEIIERWPHIVELLIASGFAGLADPAHRALVEDAAGDLEMACAKHGVRLEEMREKLSAAIIG